MEAIVILVLIVANGILAMSEIAVVSARKVRLQQWANQGNSNAKAALILAEEPTRFLSTVQFGITLVGVMAGAFGGTTIAEQLTHYFSSIDWLAPYGEALGFGIVILCITYLSLVVGELVPKRFALQNPERIASIVANPMRLLSSLALPIVRLLSASTELVLRLLRAKPTGDPPVTEEEIKLLLQQGAKKGIFEESEHKIIERAFSLADCRVSRIMTPRKNIVWLQADDSFEQIKEKIKGHRHSRYPLGQGSRDNILGVLDIRDLLTHHLTGQAIDLKTLVRQPLYVPESMRALKLLEMFKQSRNHIAFVVDEHGAVRGLVTLNDVLEEITGDIAEINDNREQLAVQRADGSWLLDGMMPIAKFKELFNIGALPLEETNSYQTLGGFVISYLERIPKVGEQFNWQELSFEVVDMDGSRVDKVIAKQFSLSPKEMTA